MDTQIKFYENESFDEYIARISKRKKNTSTADTILHGKCPFSKKHPLVDEKEAHAKAASKLFAYAKCNGSYEEFEQRASEARRRIAILTESLAILKKDTKNVKLSSVLHFYRQPCLLKHETVTLLELIAHNKKINSKITAVHTEVCFNVEISRSLTSEELMRLTYLLMETFQPEQFRDASFLPRDTKDTTMVEVGPRMNFCTAWSSNAVTICQQCGIGPVIRVEQSRRLQFTTPTGLTPQELAHLHDMLYDTMTECIYEKTLTSFKVDVIPQPVITIPVLSQGRAALEVINKEMGLGFDSQDLDYYTDLFQKKIKRDPTNVECFDIAQSNSEHSRHWFFNGKLVFDGKVMPQTLFQLVKAPWKKNRQNSIIGFCDNSSALKGFDIVSLLPKDPCQAGPMVEKKLPYHITFTAETHNFPTGVCPFAGAETGPGGRIRDGHAAGSGSLVLAGTAAYCVGNLNIPGYPLPWENSHFQYPSNLAKPLSIIIEASNGASDYGNKFGEPMIQGYCRSFGLRLFGGERREWIKPIMFTGGVGQIDARHCKKGLGTKGILLIKLGGPAYRIGMGGGAASSMVQGDNAAHLDFNAVQRGDAEMEQKVNRVIRTMVELGEDNPIISIHDQGAGGNGNVLKELAEPGGAKIEIRDVLSGDDTLSVMELWGAEYQENDALLLHPKDLPLFQSVCLRENAPFSVVGTITGDGKIVVHDSNDDSTPVNLFLDDVLGKLPAKTFKSKRVSPLVRPLRIPQETTVADALERVLRLMSVGSKRFLTSKVDRCVTGLVAQQQCVGSLHIPLADVAVTAQSHFGVTGSAIAIGEQPIKGLIDVQAMARMSVAEALTNLVWAKITSFTDIKASGNWMWAAKMEGEAASMYDAASAMSEMMLELGIALDGGKDSLSMAARAPRDQSSSKSKGQNGEKELVKCPGALVISVYAGCPDVTLTVTPDLKLPGESVLLLINLTNNCRLGGSALAQVYEQIGAFSPDLKKKEFKILRRTFEAIQNLLEKKLILSGHDRSDGGLITTVLEMTFAGNCGCDLSLRVTDPIPYLFNEEVGLVLEIAEIRLDQVMKFLKKSQVPVIQIGKTRTDKNIKIINHKNGTDAVILQAEMPILRDVWEETSFELEKLQCNPECVEQEKNALKNRSGPSYHLSFTPAPTPPLTNHPKTAVIRQEGTNSDREMLSALHTAGFEAWDIHMSDLLAGKVNLDSFRGVVFPGGFSYGDVLGSAKGWSGVINFNNELCKAFQTFYNRKDTFSLGVCNGCQLMALLGWVPFKAKGKEESSVRFIDNISGRFESRWATITIQSSPAIMLKGMEGSTFGVWVAHGEGRAFFPKQQTLDTVLSQSLAPLRYVDDDGKVTTDYPANPNGSVHGIAGLCSPDGRHFAMMPHPERSFLKWQWPYMPLQWKEEMKASPWLKLFQNAREWCEQQ